MSPDTEKRVRDKDKETPPYRSYFLIALAIRFLIGATTRTFFQPDEFFQAVEIAHRKVFFHGMVTWEWALPVALRSSLHVYMFLPFYYAIRFLGIDSSDFVLRITPRIPQILLAAAADVGAASFASSVLGPSYFFLGFYTSMSSFFNAYTSSRTFVNSTEAALTAIALGVWPFRDLVYSRLALALSVAALSCVLRPPSVIFWLPFGLLYLSLWPWTARGKITLLAATVAAGASAVSFAADSLFYLRPVFTPYTFFKANVADKISSFYGSTHFHYYVTQAIPVMTLALCPFIVYGYVMHQWRRSESVLASRVAKVPLTSLWVTILVYSCLDHKEWRFIHFLLPVLHLYALPVLQRSIPPGTVWSRTMSWILLVNMFASIYVNRYHMMGQGTIMSDIRHLPNVHSLGFMMPCHSTAWQSQLHNIYVELPWYPSGSGGKIWALSCNPPICGDPSYVDETTLFYNDPEDFIVRHFASFVSPSFPSMGTHSVDDMKCLPGYIDYQQKLDDPMFKFQWPSHLVVFESLLLMHPEIEEHLEYLGYVQVLRRWNGFFHDDINRLGDVIVLAWKEPDISDLPPLSGPIEFPPLMNMEQARKVSHDM